MGFLARAGSFLVATLAVGTASAHTGHATHTPESAGGASLDLLPLALFASGLLVLGAGLFLSIREDVDDIYAAVGVGLGLAGLAGAVVTYLL